jgi:hypothetical protein
MTGWSSCLPACPPPTVPAKLTLLVTAREMQPKSVSTEAQGDGLSGDTRGFVWFKPPPEICWIEWPSGFTSTPSFFVYLRRSGELWVVGAKWRTYVSQGLGLWHTKNKILGMQVCDSQTQITNLCLCNTNTNLILGTLHYLLIIRRARAELVAVTVPSKKPVYRFTHPISARMYVRSLYQASKMAGKG